MIEYKNDSISIIERPNNFDELGDIKFSDTKILFYYEIKST